MELRAGLAVRGGMASLAWPCSETQKHAHASESMPPDKLETGNLTVCGIVGIVRGDREPVDARPLGLDHECLAPVVYVQPRRALAGLPDVLAESVIHRHQR